MTHDESPAERWDARFSIPDYVYGTEPNDFVRECAPELAPGSRILCLAEGEGRNAVFLAGEGHRVVAVDQSRVGLAKARRLAGDRGVVVDTVIRDLADLQIEPAGWDAIVSIWCHVPGPLRASLHRRVVDGLKSGGMLVLEAYTPRQLDYGTGGPPDPDRLMTLAGLQSELRGLEFEVGREVEREIHEGIKHHGLSHVVQVRARKTTTSFDEENT